MGLSLMRLVANKNSDKTVLFEELQRTTEPSNTLQSTCVGSSQRALFQMQKHCDCSLRSFVKQESTRLVSGLSKAELFAFVSGFCFFAVGAEESCWTKRHVSA